MTAVEPEAAYLRNVLRKVIAIHESDLPREVARDQVLAACHETLQRPQTNGEVIDKLQREVAQLSHRHIDVAAFEARAKDAERRASEAEAALRDAQATPSTSYDPRDVEAVVDAAAAYLRSEDTRSCAIAETATISRAVILAESLPEKECEARGDQILRLLLHVVNTASEAT